MQTTLAEVELGINYVLIVNSNAGLWGYNIGDTIKFVSLDPPRVKVTGRVKHYTSAFGEHVIAEEIERALKSWGEKSNMQIQEFHVAPQTEPKEGLPYHEWILEVNDTDQDFEQAEQHLDQCMQSYNIYYKDLIEGKVLRPLIISPVKPGTFVAYMKSQGKLGGQNKIPRLANDRKIADFLLKASAQ